MLHIKINHCIFELEQSINFLECFQVESGYETVIERSIELMVDHVKSSDNFEVILVECLSALPSDMYDAVSVANNEMLLIFAEYLWDKLLMMYLMNDCIIIFFDLYLNWLQWLGRFVNIFNFVWFVLFVIFNTW